MNTSSSGNCKDCRVTLGRSFWTFWEKNDYLCEKKNCGAHLCTNCFSRHPLLVASPDHPPEDISHATLCKFCKFCFEQTSTLDFTKSFDVIEGTSDVLFVFVHGGGGSRAMFSQHALELQTKYGHSSLLLDLPGHGALVDTPLDLDSCAETLEKVLQEIDTSNAKKLVYVGGSLGAYIGFVLLVKFQDRFHGAVLMDCGQNVGPGASYHAKVGLVLLSYMGSHCSNATLLKLMWDISKKSKADYHLMTTVFGAGMFFDQGAAQVECLKAVAPAEYIPSLQFPILFMNGSLDHRDSETKWLELCANKASSIQVYEGGDHFFMHDSRFLDDILTRMNEFYRESVAQPHDLDIIYTV